MSDLFQDAGPLGAVAEAIVRAGLAAVDPAAAVRAHLRLDGSRLLVGASSTPVADVRRVLVVGAGKASAPMAAAVEDIVGSALPVAGCVVVRYGHTERTHHVRIAEAAHPVPDEAGLRATREIVALLADADERDLVVCLISGGASALLTLPAEGLSLGDLQAITDLLLRRGATIHELNAVRKHLDQVKGGGLARLAAPSAVVTLALSDVVGSAPDTIGSGPTAPDVSTWADAAAVLDSYRAWEVAPAAVVQRIRAGLAGEIPDTPKPGDGVFERTTLVVVGSNVQACEAAASEARRRGLNVLLLSSFVEGEANQVGRVLASLLREVNASGRPLPRPCLIVAGGETTVTVRGAGSGGRNQELALGAALALQGVPDVLLASVGTDGSDGPTDAAGAWADGRTLERARARGLDPQAYLAANDTYAFFDGLGALIRTGPTRTNVNDLYVLLAL